MKTHDRFGIVIRPSMGSPVSPGRYCADSGCEERVAGQKRYCEMHRTQRARISKQKHQASRDRRRADLEARCARYGVTIAEYEAMHAAQGGACAICGGVDEDRSLAIDHDHATGFARGLLCSPCNRALGLLRDSPDRARSAAQYLETHRR